MITPTVTECSCSRRHTEEEWAELNAEIPNGFIFDDSWWRLNGTHRAIKRLMWHGRDIGVAVEYRAVYEDTGDYYREFKGIYPFMRLTEWVDVGYGDHNKRSVTYGATVKLGKLKKCKWSWGAVRAICTALTDEVIDGYLTKYESKLNLV